MKKLLFAIMGLVIVSTLLNVNLKALAQEDYVKIEIPASEIESIDVKYDKTTPSATEKALDATKDATDKTVTATKKGYHKALNATKKGYKKTVESTKKITDKSINATKKGYKKTVETTKDLSYDAKDVIDNLNPTKPVTLEGLEKKAAIKNLKTEKNQKRNAYNSRIKDLSAQIEAANYSTTITMAEKQNKIYTLTKEKEALINLRDKETKEYNDKIKELRNSK